MDVVTNEAHEQFGKGTGVVVGVSCFEVVHSERNEKSQSLSIIVNFVPCSCNMRTI